MAHPLEHQDLVLNVIPNCEGKRILDAGCGKGNWGYMLRSLRNGETACMVGLDISEKYLDFVKKFNVYDELVLGNICSMPFEDRSFDLVLACEVIEHLPKEQGWVALKELERVCRGRIVVTTPNGFMYQGALNDVESERHLSAWKAPDLRRLGYTVRGFGFRFVRPTKIPYLYGFFTNVFTPISYMFPQLAGFLIAYKDVSWGPRG